MEEKNLISLVDIRPGKLTPYWRGRGDLKKLPLTDHGEARRHKGTTTFFVMLWLKIKAFKSFVWGVP